DRILSVNGVSLTGYTHEQAVRAIRSAGQQILLAVQHVSILDHAFDQWQASHQLINFCWCDACAALRPAVDEAESSLAAADPLFSSQLQAAAHLSAISEIRPDTTTPIKSSSGSKLKRTKSAYYTRRSDKENQSDLANSSSPSSSISTPLSQTLRRSVRFK